jgi:hypothetical protein
MKRLLLTSLLGLPVLFLFQNCQKATYSAADESSTPGYLTAVDGDENSAAEEVEEETPPAPPASDATGEYICILDGPGNSTKLGLAQEAMASQHKTPGLICMTQNACSNIVSKAFDVKGPKHAVFCKSHGNPHVIRLGEDEIQQKVDEYLAADPG